MTMNNRLQQNLINKAIALYEVPQSKFRHFTFIVERNRVVSLGWNISNKTHPMAAKWKYRYPFIHSELAAIKNFPGPINELYKYTFVNIRLGRKRELLMAKPCICCSRVLVAFGINHLYYSDEGRFSVWEG